MQSARRTPNHAAPRVALVLDAGGARSAYQVGALEVLLPALAERGARPRVLIGTSAGALLSGVLAATAHLEADDQVALLKDVLGQTTKRHVMRPLWRQVPEVLARYTSETLGLSGFLAVNTAFDVPASRRWELSPWARCTNGTRAERRAS